MDHDLVKCYAYSIQNRTDIWHLVHTLRLAFAMLSHEMKPRKRRVSAPQKLIYSTSKRWSERHDILSCYIARKVGGVSRNEIQNML